MAKSLYDQDTVLWSAEQARAIRDAAAARINTPAPIDWDNVAEEIESLGRSERSALRSRIQVVVEHLLKLQVSPAELPRGDRIATVRTQRTRIELVLDDSPSLRREVPGMLAWAIPRARRDVAASLADRSEQPVIDLDQLTFTEDQVLGDWLPDHAIANRKP
ncbi:MAG TPA: DUF29 domain-containing protein [Acetobacteraceae bacterium]|nr:DUF29 domain-containing protein [Acetobacteraceae bacterium]